MHTIKLSFRNQAAANQAGAAITNAINAVLGENWSFEIPPARITSSRASAGGGVREVSWEFQDTAIFLLFLQWLAENGDDVLSQF